MKQKPVALILDDDPFFLRIIEKTLAVLGCGAVSVSTVEDFWEAYQKHAPDLCLIDLQIGASSGLDLIESIRSEHQLKVPIVVVSATGEPEVVSHSLEIGANDFILKPFNRTLFASKMAQFVRTEEINEEQENCELSGTLKAEATIALAAEITCLDELGIGFASHHLIPKGSVVRAHCELLTNLGATNGCLVCISSTALIPGTESYELYAEFEAPSQEFLQCVRQHLSNLSGRKVS